MERYYVGLDVHSRESVFVIKRADDIIARGTIPTTPAGLEGLRAAHQLPPGTPVALETGTSAFFVARELARRLYQRNSMIPQPNEAPKLFIISSSEAIAIAVLMTAITALLTWMYLKVAHAAVGVERPTIF